MPIRIECRGADTLPLDAIEEFQGNLKKRTKADVEKIITSITNYGFSFPFFVWNGDGHNRCLDGHGRIQALAEMRRRGENLPLFPVSYVEAKDEAEAKQKLLRLNSQYGTMSVDSVLEFMDGLEIESGELALPAGVLSFGDDGKKPEDIANLSLSPPNIDADILAKDRFYFSYSGGRDSTLTLAKTWPLLKSLGKQAEALYVDTGAEFPDLLPYIIRITRSLGISLRVLKSKRNFLEIYSEKNQWPDAIFRDCIETLISGTIDEYCGQVEGEYVLVRGGRGKQKTSLSGSKKIQHVASKPNMTIYNPIFDIDQETYDAEVAELPLWRGYALGFDRTACWCCPFQCKKQWDALKTHYPFLWEEMKLLMSTFAWKEHEGDGYIKRVRSYWGAENIRCV